MPADLRRKLLGAGQGGEGGASAATTLPDSAVASSGGNGSGSEGSEGSGSGVPRWVRDDPVWQVAKEAAASSFGSEAHGHIGGTRGSSGAGGVTTKDLDTDDDGDEGAGAALHGELAEAGANFTAGGGSLELPRGADEGLPPAPRLPEYDGSEDGEAEEDRSAVAAAAQEGNEGLWERERSGRSGSGSGSGSGTGGEGGGSRRRRSLLYDGPKPGTILNWL